MTPTDDKGPFDILMEAFDELNNIDMTALEEELALLAPEARSELHAQIMESLSKVQKIHSALTAE